MNLEFPRFLYKTPYEYFLVTNQEEYDSALSQGWSHQFPDDPVSPEALPEPSLPDPSAASNIITLKRKYSKNS